MYTFVLREFKLGYRWRLNNTYCYWNMARRKYFWLFNNNVDSTNHEEDENASFKNLCTCVRMIKKLKEK